MVLVGAAAGWVVPGPARINDLGVLAGWVHDEAASKAAAGVRDVLAIVGYVLLSLIDGGTPFVFLRKVQQFLIMQLPEMAEKLGKEPGMVREQK